MPTESQYVTEFNNLRNQEFWRGFSNEQLKSIVATAMVAGGGAAGTATIGDCKSGLQTSDHSGWILLDGRAKSTLTPAQQTAATSLGIGANLPNATGRAFVQGTLGAAIGSSTISLANLPNVNLSGGNHSHSITDPGHSHTILGRADGGTGSNHGLFSSAGSNFSVINNSTTGISLQNSGSLSIPLGGSGAAYTPSAIGVNQFLYLGQ